MEQTFSLTLESGDFTIRAADSGRTWNGYAVPLLTAEQAAQVADAIGEPVQAGESAGLTWEIVACEGCGMVHSDEHSCEPIWWGNGAS